MVHIVEAIYDHGVFKPIGAIPLSEGARVQLHIEEQAANRCAQQAASNEELPSLLERMRDFVGTVHDLPPDASINLDHYLYGTPKRQ